MSTAIHSAHSRPARSSAEAISASEDQACLPSTHQLPARGRVSEFRPEYQANDNQSIADKSPYPSLISSSLSSSPAAITWRANA